MNEWILGLAIVGLLIAVYIYRRKSTKQEVVCMIGSDCNKVVNSKYGKTFGVENTVGGIAYYVCVIIGISLLMNTIQTPFISLQTLLVSAGILASLFSVYLTYIQLRVLKEMCEWCMLSALITIAILVLEVIAFA